MSHVPVVKYEDLTFLGVFVAFLYGIARLFAARLLKGYDKMQDRVEALEREQQGAYNIFATKDDLDKTEGEMNERIKYLERHQGSNR